MPAQSAGFGATGEMRFPGFTETMPVAQVNFGAGWGAVFGTSAVALDFANVFLAIVAALMLYALAIRCGARWWQAFAASGLLICNPCYLFLSFSFMSEIAFLAALLGSQLAFADAVGKNQLAWLWLSASLAVVAFAVRPFGGVAIFGSMGAFIIYDAIDPRTRITTIKRVASMLAPFGFALIGCALVWIWLTVLRTPPWKLTENAGHLAYIFKVSPLEYLRMGILAPALYLGIVLSPLALIRVVSKDSVRILAVASAIFVVTLLLVRSGSPYPSTPEMSCFGGWSNALILRGMPNRFEWHDGWRYVAMLLGSVGAAGIVFAAGEVIPKLTRPSAAVLIAAGVYWFATVPLWLFNDRYYLVMIPAGALILALAPLPQKLSVKMAALVMTAVMGVMSLGGVYSYERGLEAVMTARDVLVKRGIARNAIDAGYELNGQDLYRFAQPGGELPQEAADIPMITSAKIAEYTIVARPVAGAEVIGRIPVPGPFGVGSREIDIVRRVNP